MKSNNILRTFLTCAFLLGVLTMNAQTKVYVHKTDGTAAEFNIGEIDSISFTAPTTVSYDYTKLRLNEVSGAGGDPEKFYELINTGTEEINLEGCKIYYNNEPFNPSYTAPLTWTGCATQIIKAGELLTLMGRNNPCSFTTGLTAQRVIRVTLFDPAGNLIDEFLRAQDDGEFDFGTSKSFSRVPDGTGLFYFTTPTPGAMNGTSTTGLIEVPTTREQLVINEVDGIGKFIELYNRGLAEISLQGYTLVKNETQVWWTGGNVSLKTGEFYTISQTGQSTGCASESTGVSGISPKQNVIFELKNPAGVIIDKFVRTNGKGWGDGVTPAYDDSGTNFSFSRLPDGIGSFQLAVPSCNAPNNKSEGDIITNP